MIVALFLAAHKYLELMLYGAVQHGELLAPWSEGGGAVSDTTRGAARGVTAAGGAHPLRPMATSVPPLEPPSAPPTVPAAWLLLLLPATPLSTGCRVS